MIDHFHACDRCGQTVITRADPPVCQTCARRPEPDPTLGPDVTRLFNPPATIRGQLNLEGT